MLKAIWPNELLNLNVLAKRVFWLIGTISLVPAFAIDAQYG